MLMRYSGIVFGFLVLIVLNASAAKIDPDVTSLVSKDLNNNIVGNVFAQGLAYDVAANGTSATVTGTFKSMIGNGTDSNGSSYVVEMVSDGNLRYNINSAPTVTTITGSRLPGSAGKQIRVKATDKAAVICETGTCRNNLTRMR